MVGYFILNIIAYIAVVWWLNDGFEWIFWAFVSFLAIPIQIFMISILLYAGLTITERIRGKHVEEPAEPIEEKPNENIVCSAFNYNGIIVAGLGQYQCINAIIDLKPDVENDANFFNESNQGFITSTGRFVDRFEAWDIAVANNQIKYNNDREPFKVNGKPILMSIHLFNSDDIFANDQLIQELKKFNKDLESKE